MWVQSLVRKLRSCKLWGTANNLNKENKENFALMELIELKSTFIIILDSTVLEDLLTSKMAFLPLDISIQTRAGILGILPKTF